MNNLFRMSIYQYVIATLLLFIGVAPSTVKAQQVISLQEAINYSLKNGESVKKARLDIERVNYTIKEVRAGALPQIDATSQLARSLKVQQFILPAEFMGGKPGEFIAVEAGTAWNAMSQVQLNQQIFNQSVFTGLKASKTSKEYYVLAEKVAEENLIQQVATNYYQVIITREQLKVIDANIDRVSKLEKMVSNQFDVGLAKRIDLDRVKVNKNNLIAQRQQIQYAIVQQKNLLKYYMGMPVSEEIEIPESSITELENEAKTKILDDRFQVEQLNPFQVLKKQEELLSFQRKAYKAEYYPSLALGANYIYNTQSNKFNLYTSNALNYGMSAITLTLKIPIFDGNARSARVKQATVDILKVQEDLRNSSNALTMAYENAKIQIKNNLNTIESQKANKELAEEVYNSTQNNYHNGLASLTDLLTAEIDLVSAQNSYNEALLNYKVAEIELIKSNGNIKSLIVE